MALGSEDLAANDAPVDRVHGADMQLRWHTVESRTHYEIDRDDGGCSIPRFVTDRRFHHPISLNRRNRNVPR